MKKVPKTRRLPYPLPNMVRSGVVSALVWSETSNSAHTGSYSRKIDDFEAVSAPSGAQRVPGRGIALWRGLRRWNHRIWSPGDRT